MNKTKEFQMGWDAALNNKNWPFEEPENPFTGQLFDVKKYGDWYDGYDEYICERAGACDAEGLREE